MRVRWTCGAYHTGPAWMPAPNPSSTSTRTAISRMACCRRPRWWNARTRRNVGTLALTDHDTTAGLDEARAACAAPASVSCPASSSRPTGAAKLFTSSAWRSTRRTPGFSAHLAAVRARRRQRLGEIGERLEKTRPAAGPRTRPRPARPPPPRACTWRACSWSAAMPATRRKPSIAGSIATRPATCRREWPALASAMSVLRDSGALPVLAHPHRYRLSSGQLRELTAAFAQEGGAALEASMAGMSPNDADRIASLCRRFNLHASMGSDFHDPAVPWNPLGRWLKLAAGLEPVTELLKTEPADERNRRSGQRRPRAFQER